MEGDEQNSQGARTSRGRRGRERILAAAVDFFAQEGVGDISLRGIAAAIGTSHRMIIYHFGSREGLLSAVVERFSEQNNALLRTLMADSTDVVGAAQGMWHRIVENGSELAPLYFELAAQAMHGKPEAAALGRPQVEEWLSALRTYWQRVGRSPEEAAIIARIDYAFSIGILHDLMLTGDREAVDQAIDAFNQVMHDRFDL